MEDRGWEKGQVSIPFLRGPIPLEHLQAAMDVGPGALRVMLAVWHQAGLNRRLDGLRLTQRCRELWRIDTQIIYRASPRLESSGILEGTRRNGCKPTYRLRCPPGFHR